MKNRLLVSLSLVALTLGIAVSQAQQPAPEATTVSQRLQNARAIEAAAKIVEESKLTKFNLDFPGGTPRQLITAIEQSMDKPVNAIIPAEYADFQMPPLKMNNVGLSLLFETLKQMSRKTERYVTGTYSGGSQTYQQVETSYGFRAIQTERGYPDDSIWFFYVEKPNVPPAVSQVIPKICRFYPLTPYLDRGVTVDDITTAIQTGWKMLGDKEAPAISFHKETKLLIAVGEPAKLETIDAVLKALTPTSGDAFTDRMNSLLQKAGAGMPSPPAQLAPVPAVSPLPDKAPRTLRPPNEKTNSVN